MNDPTSWLELHRPMNSYDFEVGLLLPENECRHGALPGELDAPCSCFKALQEAS